eukprot:scaffold44324_cov30-Tisochrysis_lutea.AAC.1
MRDHRGTPIWRHAMVRLESIATIVVTAQLDTPAAFATDGVDSAELRAGHPRLVPSNCTARFRHAP